MDIPESLPTIIEYYREFRTSLFASSLTLGTFLFTMKTFIIQTMKKDVYDDESYQKSIKYRRSTGLKESYYGSLKRFSFLMVAAIALAFVSAFVQISAGHSRSPAVIWFCLVVVSISWILVGWVLYLVARNLNAMLDRAEKTAREKYEPASTCDKST